MHIIAKKAMIPRKNLFFFILVNVKIELKVFYEIYVNNKNAKNYKWLNMI